MDKRKIPPPSRFSFAVSASSTPSASESESESDSSEIASEDEKIPTLPTISNYNPFSPDSGTAKINQNENFEETDTVVKVQRDIFHVSDDDDDEEEVPSIIPFNIAPARRGTLSIENPTLTQQRLMQNNKNSMERRASVYKDTLLPVPATHPLMNRNLSHLRRANSESSVDSLAVVCDDDSVKSAESTSSVRVENYSTTSKASDPLEELKGE
jgi:hypothetical protein